MFSFVVQKPQLPLWLDFGLSIWSMFGGNSQDCVHSPQSRHCWHDGFDINTDYEAKIPPGKLVEYDFTISEAVLAPDGYLTNVTLVNGVFPGPTLEAEWGDTIRITIHNNLTNHNGTSIHWHGIRQFETNWLDGVPGVTQCPSKVLRLVCFGRETGELSVTSLETRKLSNSERCNMGPHGIIHTTVFSVSINHRALERHLR
ncbi:Cupredoxin [Macrophomina phaseolina MS6]|uniref:Cupredoxin n=1 Tax=Macrophomina phaseolina (strain MS6) TaxID=1126212 RepID=K2S3N8_MACPH|nr:Cupredoxin [Macrophomina phaseolina MS6]